MRQTTDLVLISTLDRVCFPGDAPVEVEAPRVWWAEGELAFAGVHPLPDQGLVYFCRAGVVPGARGRGLHRQSIRVRLRWARAQGLEPITDTAPWNLASANNLISEGFRLYCPQHKWAGSDALYWRYPLI